MCVCLFIGSHNFIEKWFRSRTFVRSVIKCLSLFLENQLECENHHNFYESSACQNMYYFTLHLQQCFFSSSLIHLLSLAINVGCARVYWMIFNRKIFWAICWNDDLILRFISYNSARERKMIRDENQLNTHIISCDNRNENQCHSNKIWSVKETTMIACNSIRDILTSII